jgi:hypothetical protein
MEEQNGEREKMVLQYLMAEGYSQPNAINSEILQDFSIHTVRRILKSLLDQKFVEYKEISNESGKGAGERVYYLSRQALNVLGKSGAEITSYLKRLQSVHILHLRHFLEVRKTEKLLLRATQNIGFCGEGINEFSDYQGKLQIKKKGKILPFRSDAELKIKGNDGTERLTLKIERDMGTENLTTIARKFKAYAVFLTSHIVTEHATTFPIYLLFVASEKRILSILNNIKEPVIEKFCLFLPEEKLDIENPFTNLVLLRRGYPPTSLGEIIENRNPLLEFCNAICRIKNRQKIYDIHVHSRCTTAIDPFFPMDINVNGKTVSWKPDAHIRIKKLYPENGNYREALFAVIMSACRLSSEQISHKIAMYEGFLNRAEIRMKVTSLPKFYGCFIIIEEDSRFSQVQKILENFAIRHITRIIARPNCTPEKIVGDVWMGIDGATVALFPPDIFS